MSLLGLIKPSQCFKGTLKAHDGMQAPLPGKFGKREPSARLSKRLSRVGYHSTCFVTCPSISPKIMFAGDVQYVGPNEAQYIGPYEAHYVGPYQAKWDPPNGVRSVECASCKQASTGEGLIKPHEAKLDLTVCVRSDERLKQGSPALGRG